MEELGPSILEDLEFSLIFSLRYCCFVTKHETDGDTVEQIRRQGNRPTSRVLLTGGTGYVAGRLIPLLEKKGVMLRCLAREPDKLRPNVAAATEVVHGDVLDCASLKGAMRGIDTAYYLVHLMSNS